MCASQKKVVKFFNRKSAELKASVGKFSAVRFERPKQAGQLVRRISRHPSKIKTIKTSGVPKAERRLKAQ
jgi:hypothetical protein